MTTKNKKRYHFTTNDEITNKCLDRESNKAEAIQNIVEKYFNGDLINKSDQNLENLIKRKRAENIDANTENKKLDSEIKKRILRHYDSFGTMPSPTAKHAIKENVESHYVSYDAGRTYDPKPISKPEIKNISPYDEKNNRLQCPDCGNLFIFDKEGGISKAKDDFIDHLQTKHNRIPKQYETDILKKIGGQI